MATPSIADPGRAASERTAPRVYRGLAWLGVGGLTAAYLSVLYHVVDVVGRVEPFVALVGVAVVLAVLARSLSRRVGFALGGAILVVGLALYVTALPAANREALGVGRFLAEMASLLTGYSVLRMTDVGTWALAVTPAPTFLALSLALRRQWEASAAVGSLALGFFVLTGDSGSVATMLGVLGATGAVAFGRLARHGAGRQEGELVAVLLALMVLGAGTVSAVPGSGSPLAPPGSTRVSGDVIDSGGRVTVGGSISLSPDVFFYVTASRAAYWRVAAYDRFTGDAWLRTDGPADPYAGEGPPEPTVRIGQRFTAKRTLSAYPAAATPVATDGFGGKITGFGDLASDRPLRENESYVVVSERPVAGVSRLQAAGTDYPAVIERRYSQVPGSTTDRVRALSARVTSEADTPYETAVAIERWLETNKAYSLDAPKPRGRVVDTFLFEMDAGYCTYYATAMTVMLRTQGVPARFVTGYTAGQQVDGNTWVVRGLDSHAWVEVYFPDVGWVRFDPTPGGPRVSAEQARLDRAGVAADGGPVPQDDGLFESEGPTAVRRPNVGKLPAVLGENDTTNGSVSPATTVPEYVMQNGSFPGVGDEGGGGPSLPGPQSLAIWGVLVIGLGVAVHRSGATVAVYRGLWLRTAPRGDPTERIEGAFSRVEYVLARGARPRRTDETVREYVDRVSDDERVREVSRLLERARYADRVAEADAERAGRLADEVVDDLDAVGRFGVATVFNRLLS
ncbi:MAG: DUF3488 and DUF4129 domain-containing transglutaminase family protein [Halanaeroarchaeum sp.]